MRVNAHELAQTRLCRAANCPDDATTYHLLCDRHEQQRRRGTPVPLHHTPQPQPPTKRCNTCQQWLPLEAFKKRDPNRRRCECRNCTNTQRRAQHAAKKAADARS